MDVKDSRGQGFKDSSEKGKTLIKLLENKHLNPGLPAGRLESWNPGTLFNI
ncbi:MAG: hypothetical protein BMS9Abin21_010 [Thermodesulfovibrionia bacterium]|nr:MAG: hypothetical protein BMS9Abin21_010 [Thermodesulfovibrionia bacterium]